MDYDRPALGERLAADYVLGAMPQRARRRFEGVMERNATLASLVAAWSERLTPLDALTDDAPPPPHVWRAICRHVGYAAPARRAAPQRVVRRFFAGLAAAALVACAAVVICFVLDLQPLRRDVQIFAEQAGLAGWIDSASRATHDIGLSTLRLGVGERERPRWIRAALLLTNDALPLTAAPPRRAP